MTTSKQNKIIEDVEPLSPAWRREIKRRITDSDNPLRYAVFSDICGNGRWRLWLDVSGDGYGMSIDQATLFKREHVARCVAKAYSEGKRNTLQIATLTTKDGKRRVLKYEKRKRQTRLCG
ncbi:MAG: hypothetical protein A2283_13310 [Lentisphaerae bacterium RIFOXYA12_FULL_48_11]|nr:MAG: hypothetical protein A2283_13310 [Lentisphaerae bacterium RIFOXYA12_FULL_48_11]